MTRKPKQKPKPRTFKVALANGQEIEVTLSQTTETIEKPIKYAEKYVRGFILPLMRRVKDQNGNVVTANVQVDGCRVTLKLPDGTILEGRSCCKSPDQYRSITGYKHALRRIFKADSGISLNKYEKGGKPVRKKVKQKLTGEDRRIIQRAVMSRGRTTKKDQESAAG